MQITDEQWLQLLTEGRITPDDENELRSIVDQLINHYSWLHRQQADAATRKEINMAMKDIVTACRRLRRNVDAHPEIRQRLAGVLWLASGLRGDARQDLDRRISLVQQMEVLANFVLSSNTGGKRSVYPKLGSNADHASMVFTSALLNLWRFIIKKPLGSWVAGGDRDRADDLTSFIHLCLQFIGAKPISLEATKKRVARARKIMDANEASGLEWNVLRAGPVEKVPKRP